MTDELKDLDAFHLFHRLWTRAVGTPGYVKKEWQQLERWIKTKEADSEKL